MARVVLRVMSCALALGHGLAVQFRHVHQADFSLQTSFQRFEANRSAAFAVTNGNELEVPGPIVGTGNKTLGYVGASLEGSSNESAALSVVKEAEDQMGHAKITSNASQDAGHELSETAASSSPVAETLAFAEIVSAVGFRALSTTDSSFALWAGGAILLCVFLPVLSLIIAGCLGGVIKSSVEALDRKVIGVDVEIGRLSINPFQAYISVEDVTVNNPDGYQAPYLMKVEKIYVNIDAVALCRSCFRHIVVDDLVFTGLDVIYAKKLLSSNFNDVIDFMALDDAEKKHKTDDEAQKTPESEMQITLRRVLVEGVGMKVAAEIGGGMGPRLEVGNMDYANFSEEVGGSGALLSTAVSLLMRTILKSAVVNTMGKGAVATFSEMSFLKSSSGAVQDASSAVSSITAHLKEAVHHQPGEEASAAKDRRSSGSWFRNPLSSLTSSSASATQASPAGSEQRASGSWFRNPLARRSSA